jgi:hypothetical protein
VVKTKKKTSKQKGSSSKGKGKGLLPKCQQQAYIDHQKDQERSEISQAKYLSLQDIHNQNYRGIAESSDSEEGKSPTVLTDDELDFDVSSQRPHPPLRTKTQAVTDHIRKAFGFLSSASNDDETESCSTSHQKASGSRNSTSVSPIPLRTGIKLKKRKTPAIRDPGSDNDPDLDPLSSRRTKTGWTKHLRNVVIQPFTGSIPRGPTFMATATTTPVEFFLRFFSGFLFRMMALYTNKNLKKAMVTKLTTEMELRAWFGIHILMGLVRIPQMASYWSTHAGLRNELICRTMTRCRFEVLSTHLACADPEEDPKHKDDKSERWIYRRTHPLYNLRLLWDEVQRNCRRRYNPGCNLALDEAMVKYKGFLAWLKKFFMPLKPIRSGFRLRTCRLSLWVSL